MTYIHAYIQARRHIIIHTYKQYKPTIHTYIQTYIHTDNRRTYIQTDNQRHASYIKTDSHIQAYIHAETHTDIHTNTYIQISSQAGRQAANYRQTEI